MLPESPPVVFALDCRRVRAPSSPHGSLEVAEVPLPSGSTIRSVHVELAELAIERAFESPVSLALTPVHQLRDSEVVESAHQLGVRGPGRP